jgi:hypothetical protein
MPKGGIVAFGITFCFVGVCSAMAHCPPLLEEKCYPLKFEKYDLSKLPIRFGLDPEHPTESKNLSFVRLIHLKRLPYKTSNMPISKLVVEAGDYCGVTTVRSIRGGPKATDGWIYSKYIDPAPTSCIPRFY